MLCCVKMEGVIELSCKHMFIDQAVIGLSCIHMFIDQAHKLWKRSLMPRKNEKCIKMHKLYVNWFNCYNSY